MQSTLSLLFKNASLNRAYQASPGAVVECKRTFDYAPVKSWKESAASALLSQIPNLVSETGLGLRR